MDTQKDTPTPAPAQAGTEGGAHQRLSAIENMLLYRELREVAGQINAARKSLTSAINRLSAGSGSWDTAIWAKVLQELRFYNVDADDLAKAMEPANRSHLVSRLSEAFLAKVDEIKDVADEALSRTED